MEDPTVRRLAKKVFPYLWFNHKLISSVPSTIFRFSDMTVFSHWIGNAVVVYLHMYRPTLSKYLEKHIPSMPRSKLHFWTHVAFLCLHVRLTNDHVFDYFLTTCAITAEVALHCYMNGYDDVLSLASAFFCAFFENELSEGFHKSGGWKGLQQYIEDTSCKELYELVHGFIKELNSPSDHLPILISIKKEELAAERREKFMSLLSFKIGEVEREDQTSTLVTGIFHWYFMENHRMSESKPGILKRMESVRQKNDKSNISMDEGKHDESSDEVESLDANSIISNAFEPLPLQNEVQSSGSIATISETQFNNKAIQTLDISKCTKIRKESKHQLRTNNKTSEKTNFNSSYRLRELRNFYENLSASSERKGNDSKYFRINNGMRTEQKSSAINELRNRHEKINSFERYPRSVPISSENDGTFPENKNFTPGTMIKSPETFHADDALSEFTKSFQELGFMCLCVGNSSPFDEKFANHAEVMEKCRYFQNKYPSIQFAILVPNNSFASGTVHAPQTEKCDETLSENKYNEQQFSIITKEDLNNSIASPEKNLSQTEKTNFKATQTDKNLFRLSNGQKLLQNCATENTHNSSFVFTEVKENDLPSIGEASRISVTKVNENQIILKDETSLLGKTSADESTTVSRFRVTKVNESQSRDETSVFGKTSLLGKNVKNESTKISRFTIMKVDENQSKDGTSILGKSLTNESTKISRFTIMKVDENQSKDGTNILGKNLMYETTKISRFTVRKVDENELMSKVDIRFDGCQRRFSEQNNSLSSEMSGDAENETVHFQDNGSVKYQKRVSFAEHPFVNYFQAYSSDESSNSITSRENFNKNSPKDARTSRNSGHAANLDTLNPPSLRKFTASERRRRRLFQWLSSGENQSLRDNVGSSNMSSGSGFFKRVFRRSTSNNSKVIESPKENKEEMDKQKIEELRKSLEAAGTKNPTVFKI